MQLFREAVFEAIGLVGWGKGVSYWMVSIGICGGVAGQFFFAIHLVGY